MPRELPLDEIAALVDGRIVGLGSVIVTGVSSLEDAGPDDLAYVAGRRHVDAARKSAAGALVVEQPLADLDKPQVVTEHAALAFARITAHFFVAPRRDYGIDPGCVMGEAVILGAGVTIRPRVTVGDRVTIGDRVTLFPGVVVGDDVVIGDDTVMYPNVTIGDGSRIGARVIVHAGTVIGSDGFGYVQHEGRHWKVPQLGIVVIEDDVELGANVTIDRATFGRTVIGRGTKVDNLVQVGHNVVVGEHCIIVAQVGIAGSTKLGSHVMVGGQAGLSGHLEIGSRAMIAARAGVAHDLAAGRVVSGAPAMDHTTFLRAQGVFSRLPEMRRRLQDMERRLRELEGAAAAAAESDDA
ncbi:MAG: UDP-3-O-(3-hydroxymyristoyl)glucosamine N-acyltransferase [Deltaproteobacteria bacterium]|nr:UDP-3-O-(3-hydroxymyristoyl)glucosamine N-acyltransferase [Candidatus Anaeroferrophillacea bacterium]